MSRLITSFVIVTLCCSCFYDGKWHWGETFGDKFVGYFINESDLSIGYTVPEGIIDWDHVSIDSTLNSYRGILLFDIIFPHTDRIIYSRGFNTFSDFIPTSQDHISLFVVEFPDYETAFEEDRYYVRYDLTLEDFYHLQDENGNLILYFPPDERMKDIKMWPRYEDVRKKFCAE